MKKLIFGKQAKYIALISSTIVTLGCLSAAAVVSERTTYEESLPNPQAEIFLLFAGLGSAITFELIGNVIAQRKSPSLRNYSSLRKYLPNWKSSHIITLQNERKRSLSHSERTKASDESLSQNQIACQTPHKRSHKKLAICLFFAFFFGFSLIVISNVNIKQLPSQSIDDSELESDGLDLPLDKPLLPVDLDSPDPSDEFPLPEPDNED